MGGPNRFSFRLVAILRGLRGSQLGTAAAVWCGRVHIGAAERAVPEPTRGLAEDVELHLAIEGVIS